MSKWLRIPFTGLWAWWKHKRAIDALIKQQKDEGRRRMDEAERGRR